jgi:pimeloyl-ACP methyl ester carboxylesterase
MQKGKTGINLKIAVSILLAVCAMLLFQIEEALAQTNGDGLSFTFEKSGKGRPMILIPGLYCSGKVWDETVDHFKDRYQCYEITLPGFAGQPPIQSDSMLKSFAFQLAKFIRQRNMIKPVIVGHSLGGFIALLIGELYPELPGDLIIVSSAPFLPALAMSPDITVDSTSKIGIQIKNGMKNMTAGQIRQSQKFTLPSMIRDSAKIAEVTDMAVKSDPATQGEVMYELFSTDLRTEIKKIHCPILVLGDWVSYKKYGATRDNVLKNYKDQFSFASRVTIAINDSSNHFIMFDEPKWFDQQIESFLHNH